MRRWKEINASDVKMLIAHLIVMGLLKKPNMEKYWTTSEFTRTPFFGKYMPRNTFQILISNLHVADNSTDLPRDDPNHDPLHKVRPFIEMCQRRFQMVYNPGQNLSFDEACCPFKGRLRFKVYNAAKPAKFHIKLFQLCEADTAYIYGFDIYTGKDKTQCTLMAPVLDEKCTTTTKLVMGLMDKAVTNAKIKKKGDTVFRRKGPMLALKWFDKRPVSMLSTIHAAVNIQTNKADSDGNKILKPLAIVNYTQNMGGCDRSDQLIGYYTFLRKSVKWWKKLFIHLVNMVLLNAHILNHRYGHNKLDHDGYMEYMAKYLLEQGLPDCTIQRPPMRTYSTYPKIPEVPGCKRKPSRPCFACNGSWQDIRAKRIPKKSTGIWCRKCAKPLCATPCFAIFHTDPNYKLILLKKRFPDQLL